MDPASPCRRNSSARLHPRWQKSSRQVLPLQGFPLNSSEVGIGSTHQCSYCSIQLHSKIGNKKEQVSFSIPPTSAFKKEKCKMSSNMQNLKLSNKIFGVRTDIIVQPLLSLLSSVSLDPLESSVCLFEYLISNLTSPLSTHDNVTKINP
jgi:hypothetical protein